MQNAECRIGDCALGLDDGEEAADAARALKRPVDVLAPDVVRDHWPLTTSHWPLNLPDDVPVVTATIIECCQYGSVASSNVANFQFEHRAVSARSSTLGIGFGYWQHFLIGNIHPLPARWTQRGRVPAAAGVRCLECDCLAHGMSLPFAYSQTIGLTVKVFGSSIDLPRGLNGLCTLICWIRVEFVETFPAVFGSKPGADSGFRIHSDSR